MNSLAKYEYRVYGSMQVAATLAGTVGRMDAAVERTGMYLQRVLASVTVTCLKSI